MEISTDQFSKLSEAALKGVRMYASVKTTRLYFAALGIIAIFIGVLFILMMKLNPGAATGKLFFTLTFLGLGVYHIFSFPKELKDEQGRMSGNSFLYTLLLSIVILVCNLIFFSIAGQNKFLMAPAGAVAFLLPSSLLLSWNYFTDILPEAIYKPWVLPAGKPGQKVSIYLNSFQVSLQLKLNWFDQADQLFAITVPGRANLGDMFHQFLLKKETESIHIQLFDKDQKPFEWKIYAKRAMGLKMMDPGLTLIQNNVKANDTLVFERVLKTIDHNPE